MRKISKIRVNGKFYLSKARNIDELKAHVQRVSSSVTDRIYVWSGLLGNGKYRADVIAGGGCVFKDVTIY